MPPVQYQRPATEEEARRYLAAPGAFALGGGTDLLVTMREGLVRLQRVVDLRGIEGGDAIEWLPDGSLRVGATATLADIAGNERIREQFAALSMACEAVGSPALRNMGTLGGNLCQRPRCWYYRAAIPCLKSGGSDCPAEAGENQHLAVVDGGPCYAVHPSDPAVALMALEGTIHLSGAGGTRAVPIDRFFIPPSVDPTRETVVKGGEYVRFIEVPAAAAGGRQRFTKLLQRGAWDFALASLAVTRRRDGGVRLVLGGVAPAPWRVNSSIEEDAAAGALSQDDIDALTERALYDARPLSGNAYKVSQARALLREAIAFASSA